MCAYFVPFSRCSLLSKVVDFDPALHLVNSSRILRIFFGIRKLDWCLFDPTFNRFGFERDPIYWLKWFIYCLLCCFRHYWPWQLDQPSLILVWYPWLCSRLVQVKCRFFCVKCETDLSSWYTSSCGVPQGSELGDFSSCTPLLSVP